MSEKGPLEALLKSWKTPTPRADFEARVLRRLRSEPAAQSLWQRWFVEPWEAAEVIWKQQAAVLAVAATVVLFLGIVWNAPKRTASANFGLDASANFGLDAFATFPKGSFTQAYLEMVGP